MTKRKLIAFAVSLLLTLCGIAVAQQQGIGWHFDMMRASSAVANPGIHDPYEANLVLLYGYDNVPQTNNQGYLYDDSGNGMIARRSTGLATYPIIGTNGDGTVNYGLNSPTYDFKMTQTALWHSVVSPSSTSQYTMSFWLRKATTSSADNLFQWQTLAGNRCGMDNTTANQAFYNMTNSVYQAIIQVGNTTFPTGQWHNMTITLSNNNFRAYTNGVLIYSAATCTPSTSTLTAINVQITQTGTVGDRHAIYNRFLTSQEVYNIWINTHPTNRIWRK